LSERARVGRRALLCLALTVAVCAGCGYSARSMFRRDIRTVYVAGFDNRTFRRGLEVPLTRAVQAEIALRPGLRPAARQEADSVLSGELVSFEEKTQVKGEADEVLLTRVSVKVRFRWRDRLTGADIVPPQTVKESVRIAPEAERNISDYALRQVAKRVVEKMEASW